MTFEINLAALLLAFAAYTYIVYKIGRHVSLRDRFALAALTGIMANPERWKQIAEDYRAGRKSYDECSRANVVKAFSIADAAMEFREESTP